jgi:hypothetical protein
MNDSKLIAATLLEIAKNSTTELIEDSKLDQEMIDAAKKMGLIIPSPDFAIFKTKWADIGKANLNKVRLPKKAVEDGIQTLVGKNLNFEHLGAYNVCGFCLSVKIKKDEIECIQVFYKSLYPDKFEELKDKIKTKEAAVSFEIYNLDPQTKESVIKELSDGTKEITKIHCHGTGLLLINPPACPTAKIFKLIAKKEISEAEKIVDKIFSEDLIYAQLAVEEPKCVNCGKCTCGKDKEEKVMIKCEKCGKEFESSAEEKICIECSALPKEESKAEVKAEETKTQEVPVVAETQSKETKVEDPKVEEKLEDKTAEVGTEIKKEEAQPLEVIEPKIIVKVTRSYTDLFVDTYVDGTLSGTSEGKSTSKIITDYKDGKQDIVESESEYKKKFDLAEVEEKVNAAKAEKDAEISILKTEQEKVLGEKDKEITNLKQELGKKDQEIAELKTPKVEEPKQKELAVGSVTGEVEPQLEKEKKNINKIIAEKHNRK